MSQEAPSERLEQSLSRKARQALSAAQRLFSEHGYGATSMDAVAAEAGVSKATVYAHFATKEQLFAAMVQRECQAFMRQMAIPEDVHDLEPRAALVRIARAFLEAVMTPRILAIMRVVVAESRRFPELGRIFYESGPRVTLGGVVAYLERAREHELLYTDDPHLAASQFLGMLRGDLQLRALLGVADDADLARMADSTTDTFLRAYAVGRSG